MTRVVPVLVSPTNQFPSCPPTRSSLAHGVHLSVPTVCTNQDGPAVSSDNQPYLHFYSQPRWSLVHFCRGESASPKG